MPDIMNYSPLWGVWSITRPIGSGTFGDVYEAKRTDMGKEYFAAVKHISIPPRGTTLQTLQAEGVATDEASAQRYCHGLLDTLAKEIDICYELKGYTNFVSYEDHIIAARQGEIGFDVFIRMELLTSLQSHIAASGITVGGITKLCEDMCTALSVLERKQIIHRDIKPANIFVNAAGDFKLGDFGVARHMEGVSSVTLKGTYNYMAPEISRGSAVGSNSDIYSLGLVLYRLLNYNRAPFLPPPPSPVTHEEDQSALERRLSGEALPPPARVELSLPLTNVIMRACEFNPGARYQTADEMKRALQGFRGTERGPEGVTAGMFDPDATIAVERNQTRQGYAPGGSFSGAAVSHGTGVGGGMGGTGIGAGSANSGTGFTFGGSKPQSSNKMMFAVIFSIIGTILVMLVVILAILLPRRDDAPSSAKTERTQTPASFGDTEDISPAPKKTPAPAPVPRPSATSNISEASAPTVAPPTADLVADPRYFFYEDLEYALSCAYPSHFLGQASIGNERLSLRSPDGKTTMQISVEYNTGGLSAQAALSEYKSHRKGTVDYEANGSYWFAASITNGDITYYRKSFIDAAYICYFDFICPLDEIGVYSNYIGYIEDNFEWTADLTRSWAECGQFATASSTLEPQFGYDYSPHNVLNDSTSSPWVEGAAGYGIGEWVSIATDGAEQARLTEISILNGHQRDSSLYPINGRVKDFRLEFSDGTVLYRTLEDISDWQTITLPEPVITSYVRIVIESVYAGTKYEDTCIARIRCR